MKRGLILDFGGVISRSLFETHADSEAALGLAPGSLRWRGPFDPAGDALWRAMQAGEISERDYWARRTREVGALLGESWDAVATLVQRARGNDPARIVRPQTAALIRDAHAAGLRLAVLSNELDLFHGHELRTRLPLLDHFDVVCDAIHTGILKPDPRAYQDCLDALGLRADECVFVDDQARNLDGARAIGLPNVAFDVTRPDASCDAVRSMLGLPSPAQ